MIADLALITLLDGSTRAAIEVTAGKRLVSAGKRSWTMVKDRQIRNSNSVLGLVLSNGRVLIGSWDQKVWCMAKIRIYRQMTDIEIGDRLIGCENRVLTLVTVVGISCLTDIQRRLVKLETRFPFVAEGVVCHC